VNAMVRYCAWERRGDPFVEGLNYYPNSVVQRASSRNAAWLLD
jgi:hypothetical protein